MASANVLLVMAELLMEYVVLLEQVLVDVHLEPYLFMVFAYLLHCAGLTNIGVEQDAIVLTDSTESMDNALQFNLHLCAQQILIQMVLTAFVIQDFSLLSQDFAMYALEILIGMEKSALVKHQTNAKMDGYGVTRKKDVSEYQLVRLINNGMELHADAFKDISMFKEDANNAL